MRRFFLICGVLLASLIGGAIGQPVTATFSNIIQGFVAPTTMQPGTGGMWTNNGNPIPTIWNLGDRIFTGNAQNMTGNNTTTNSTWCSSSTVCPAWLLPNATLLSLGAIGNAAIVSGTRASDGDSISGATSIGLGSFVIGDSAQGHTARAIYAENQWQPTGGTLGYGYGIEIQTKNKGSNKITDPFSAPTGSIFGMQVGSGDDSYGGAATAPITAGMIFTGGGSNHAFNSGIIFSSGALTGCSSGAGTCEFAALPSGAKTNWYTAAATVSGYIHDSDYKQSSGARHLSGNGSPAGVVSCTTRCLYIRTDGGANTTLYVNETGGGTSGWAAK